MASWKDTFARLFAETDAAKEKAKADFFASLTPPNPPSIRLDQVVPLADAMTTAMWQALLKHIGPVSTDGSITIDVHETDDPTPVPQLNLRVTTGDDHEVKAKHDDTGHGPLDKKTKAGDGIALEVVQDAGVDKLLISAIQGHEVQAGATLIPATIPDPLLRKSVRGRMYYGEAYGFNILWKPTGAPHTWRNIYQARLTFMGDNLEAIPANDGDRLLVYGYPIHPDDAPYYWLYDVLDCGYHNGVYSNPIIRRASDAMSSVTVCHGAVVLITDPQALDYNHFYRITTDDTIALDTTPIALEKLDDYTSTAHPYLLTPRQLIDNNADSDDVVVMTAVKVMDNSKSIGHGYYPPWQTVLGTPGIAAFPAGDYEFRLLARATDLDGNPIIGATVEVYASLSVKHLDDSEESEFIRIFAAPITATTYTVYTGKFHLGDLPYEAPYTCSPTDRLVVNCYATTTSDEYVLVYVKWQDVTRGTRFILPIETQMAGGGTVEGRGVYYNVNQLSLDGAAVKGHAMLGPLGRRTEVITLPDGSTNGVSIVLKLPGDMSGGWFAVRPHVAWSETYQGSYAVRWSMELSDAALADITAAGTTIVWTGDAAARTALVPFVESGAGNGAYASSAGQLVRLGLYRLGADVNDTCPSAVHLLGIQIEYLARI